MTGGRAWSNLINYALFQSGWFVCVFGAVHERPWQATTTGMGLVLLHLLLDRQPRREGKLLILGFFLGLVIDTFHVQTGVLLFPVGHFHPGLPAGWVLILWLQFASILHYSLAWLADRYLLGAVLGSIGGALAYGAGVRVGAASFGADPFRCLVQIGLSWGMAMIILLWAAGKTAPLEGGSVYRLFQRGT
ncbi:MAG: DUF2878 domain-containing protein [Desulfuromonadaceae bacterium]|nr:DUF2878 domain-containing protein [Desulfuromonadaceae bacterium]